MEGSRQDVRESVERACPLCHTATTQIAVMETIRVALKHQHGRAGMLNFMYIHTHTDAQTHIHICIPSSRSKSSIPSVTEAGRESICFRLTKSNAFPHATFHLQTGGGNNHIQPTRYGSTLATHLRGLDLASGTEDRRIRSYDTAP